jgi:HAD superfamily hydrolase (TIGR01509 family)
MHDLVIFDCDGVLVDSETMSNQCLVDNLARYGLELGLEDALGFFVGGTMSGVMEKARELGATLPDDWLDEIYGEMSARLQAGCPLVGGIPELLDALDAKDVPFCVASNGHEAKMQITLGQNGLWDRFSNRMFSAYVHGVAKPDPGLFRIAAGHFGAQTPVVIEDSRSGVTAAISAGMRCLAYAAHDNGDDLCALGAEVFHSMHEVPELLAL